MTIKAKSRFKLADICLNITDGKHGDCVDEAESGFYFLSCKDVGHGVVSFDKARQITQADFLDTHRRTRLAPGDILITNSGTIGRMAIVRDTEDFARSTLQKSVAAIKPDTSKTNIQWLYYTLKYQVANLVSLAGGTAQKNLLLRDLRDFSIDLPDLETQRKAADILARYDDLIENNTRRIAIVEEMARLIYREWFVNFRFPGHENVKFVDSELGKIPEGWKVQTVNDSFEILGGATPSTKNESLWKDGKIDWYSPTDLTAAKSMFAFGSKTKINEAGLKSCSARVCPANSIMLTSRATIGVVAINRTESCTNQGFINCLPNKDFPLYYLYNWLTANTELFIRMASGATFKEISKSTFRGLQILQPSNNIVSSFESHVAPFGELIANLTLQNFNLRQTRDLLLPRLISGELDVSGIEVPAFDETHESNGGSMPAIEKTTANPAVVAPAITEREGMPQAKRPKPEQERDQEIEERTTPIDEIDTNDVMAAFRAAARSTGRTTRDELLRETSRELGYKRMGPRIEEALRGHLRAAIRRGIIASDSSEVYLATPSFSCTCMCMTATRNLS